MNANDLQNVEMGVWGSFMSMDDLFWEPNLNHPAQQRDPPPPPPAALSTNLIGRRVSRKFPGYGLYEGAVTGIDHASNKYIISFDGEPGEYKYTKKQTRKMLVHLA